ncbi:MAG: hypothetical protein EAX96_12730 [Candidatus Lokiarchaeota archaeon]|nr:hypothetical protein [Candidatus Lokiarchaeota archaeon]
MSLEISKQDILNALSEELASLAMVCNKLEAKDEKSIRYVKRLINELIKEGKIITQGRKYALNIGESLQKKVKQKSLEEIIEETPPEKIEEAKPAPEPEIVKKSKPKAETTKKTRRKKTVKLEEKQPKKVEEDEASKEAKPKKGVIRQGGIAEFMRKRTQLVGFDFGFHKHTQYVVEFIDNSLDAIETFNWKNKDFKINKGFPENVWVIQEQGDEQSEALAVLEDFNLFDFSKKTLINQFHNFIAPVIHNLDKEPYVIVRLREIEKVDTGDETKDARLFCFEIFDNGVGMIKEDLEKFGLYLASSKSKNLKQTRGSQGFGASSAFSDAQNTSAKPVVVITRHDSQQAATISAFYTTAKNEKKYELEPEEFRTKFQHGTYVRLFYQNVRYIRGYADEYIRQTALLNGHMNVIYIDPYGTTTIYQRKVLNFPSEPNYAQPHPSSVSIGDFQELLRNSKEKDITSLFEKSYVRMSRNKAKAIIENANKLLGGTINIFSSDPTKLDDRQIRALHKSITETTNCFQRSSPDALEKIFEKFPEKNIEEFLLKNFNDLTKEDLKRISNKIDIKKKKLSDFTKDDIKNLQDILRDNVLCPYSISFAKFKSISSEDNHTLNDWINSEFCSIDTRALNKIIAEVDEKLGNKILDEIPLKDLKKTEISAVFEKFNMYKPNSIEITEVDYIKLFKSKEYKDINLKKLHKEHFTGIGKKTHDQIISEAADTLGYKSIKDVPINELKAKEIKTFYDELSLLPKCPASITTGSLKELMTNSGTKSLETALKRSFINLNKEKINEILNKANDSLGGSSSLELFEPSELDEEQMNALYQSFISEKYLAPPTDTVVPVGSENLVQVIEKEYSPAFCDAETRAPTSGKGLAFGVEVAVAYGGDVKDASRATDVLYRFVNRTPKLRDNSDCAIWKATSKVNWKNYKVDMYDNGLPKGKIRVFVNVSGPFVHVMFKSQSKQALADDENLTREIQLGLEQVGRRLRNFIQRREKKKKRARRASLLIKNVKTFAKSLHIILKNDPRFKQDGIDLEKIETKLAEPIKRDVRKDIIGVLSSHWERKSEIIEDLGLSNIKDKFVKEMVDDILQALIDEGIVLRDIRDIDGVKKQYWRLAKEQEEDEEDLIEPEIIVIPGKGEELEDEEEMLEELETEDEEKEEEDIEEV